MFSCGADRFLTAFLCSRPVHVPFFHVRSKSLRSLNPLRKNGSKNVLRPLRD
jgi:hypothetical protein